MTPRVENGGVGLAASAARPAASEGRGEYTSAAVTFLPEFVEAVAERVAAMLAERSEAPRPWLDVEGAAEYLACPPSRIYALTSKRAIPFEKDGSRTLFRPEALDEYVRNGGATRP